MINNNISGYRILPVDKAVGMALAHDITEVRKDEFKGRAFKKGHIIQDADVEHLKQLGKEHIFVLDIQEDEMHENDAAYAMALALAGNGVGLEGEPKEGKINLIAKKDGLLKVNYEALKRFNEYGEVMCATLHNNTLVKKDQVVAGTRAIPLVVKKNIIAKAVNVSNSVGKILQVLTLQQLKVGLIITGNEVYHGRIKDEFAPIMTQKVTAFGCEIIGTFYCPDNVEFISSKIQDLLVAGAQMLILTGGLSVDPDDVTRFAVRSLNVEDMCYGAPVLPGSMFLIAYLHTDDNSTIPILGVPACGMYKRITIFDLVLPRVLAGERLGRNELAEMGHGGLCLSCPQCNYPVCPFGK
ncbi:MAG: molybdopterin-binding protein [Candidatus Magnetoovum sp. WYHC-5]|nr:molybdopterin-binding protein [Candidatus Magnetoovum sp. WYHC-5]